MIAVSGTALVGFHGTNFDKTDAIKSIIGEVERANDPILRCACSDLGLAPWKFCCDRDASGCLHLAP